MLKPIAVVLSIAAAAYAINAFAQMRAEMRPPLAAIGSSSSNGTSFVWFYDASERAVIACRVGQGAGDAVECKAKVSLP